MHTSYTHLVQVLRCVTFIMAELEEVDADELQDKATMLLKSLKKHLPELCDSYTSTIESTDTVAKLEAVCAELTQKFQDVVEVTPEDLQRANLEKVHVDC
jgi:hypothetical protein